jgi:hypothetical protein
MTATTVTPAPLFASFADLLTRVQRPRRRSIVPTGRGAGDRDRQRLLDDLRALNDAPADIAHR